MAEAIICRLQTPEDENGERKDINVVTSSDAIIMSDGSTLEDRLEGASIQLSAEKPNFPCLWAKIISTEA